MARKIGSIKSFNSLWIAHEKLYYFVFHEAIKELEINEEQAKNEDAISEALCLILNKVCFEYEQDIRTPDWEKPIQPVKTEELKGGKVRKRPDFSCVLINSVADTPEEYQIQFHIECKRLGNTVGSWNLNKNYVTNGIQRFDSKNHEYGKRAPSGMMIGYIIDMKLDSILDKVNQQLPDKTQKLSFSFVKKTVSFSQKLSREKVQPKEFKLIHLWVNLKNQKY